MSAVVCFDIRNFSTHVAHLSSHNRGESRKIVNVLKSIFTSLDKAIHDSNTRLGLKGKTYVNHTGDGFIAIFHGKGKCLQGLIVALGVAVEVKDIFDKYNKNAEKDEIIKSLSPLDYGIGLHIGPVRRFDYQPLYSADGKMLGVGLVGHAINLSSRIQETTKDHTFRIICTKRVYEEAITAIKAKHKEKVKKYFVELGRHNLRGMRVPIGLYGVKISGYNEIGPRMIIESHKRKKSLTNKVRL